MNSNLRSKSICFLKFISLPHSTDHAIYLMLNLQGAAFIEEQCLKEGSTYFKVRNANVKFLYLAFIY